MRRTLLIIALPVLVAGGLALWQARDTRAVPTPQDHAAFNEAVEAYHQLELEKAYELIQNRAPAIQQIPEGCELLISLFAQREDSLPELEETARACLKEGKASGIAHEGLAKALSDQKRVADGIAELEKAVSTSVDARAHAALANLYLFAKDYPKAGQGFLKAMELSDIWSVWLSRALKVDALQNDPIFVEGAIAFVLKQEKSVPSVEQQLLAAARKIEKIPQIATIAALELRLQRSETP